jgi:hypothetical protein
MDISISILAAAQYQGCERAVQATITNTPRIRRVYWCSDRPCAVDFGVPVHWIRVRPYRRDMPFDVWYNYISLRLLPAVVDADVDIHIHADGFAVNPQAWREDFLQYDYIGAVWPHMPPGSNVGNGGFSLRSRRLYDALIDWQPSDRGEDWPGLTEPHYHRLPNGVVTMPEDALLASPYRRYMEQYYDLTWAPEHIANQWSIEYPPQDPVMISQCFGFHGTWMAQQLNIELLDYEYKYGTLNTGVDAGRGG